MKNSAEIKKLTDNEIGTAAGGTGQEPFVCPVKVGDRYHLNFGYRQAHVEVIEVNIREDKYYIKAKQLLQSPDRDYISEYPFDYFWSHIVSKE